MEGNCEQLEKDIERVKEEKENKRHTVASLEQQITEQKEKISRADKNLRRVLKDIQNKCICSSDETILLQEVTFFNKRRLLLQIAWIFRSLLLALCPSTHRKTRAE